MLWRRPRAVRPPAIWLLSLIGLAAACEDDGPCTAADCAQGMVCLAGSCVATSKTTPDAGFTLPDLGLRLDAGVLPDGGAGAEDAGAGADASGTDAGPPASCGALHESETAAAPGTNDTAETAEPLPSTGTYAGELQTAEDLDFFSFEASQAGLRVRLSIGVRPSAMDAAFAVYGPQDSDEFVRVGSNPMAPDVSRELFLPVAGTYHVEVYDIRTAEGAPPVVTPGTFCYRLTLAELPPPPLLQASLPSGGRTTVLSHTVSASGAIAYYQVEVGPADQVRPFVFNLSGEAATQTAGQPGRGPDVDTALIIWDPIYGQAYAGNDDLANTNSNVAVALSSTTAARPFWLIADHYQLGNEDASEPLPAGGLQSEATLTIDEPHAVPLSSPFTDGTRRLTADRAVQWYLGVELPGQRMTVRADGSAGGLSDLLVWAEDVGWQLLAESAGGTATAAVSQVELQSDRTLFAVMAKDDLRNTAVTGAYTVTFEAPRACEPVADAVRPDASNPALNEVLWDPASSAPEGDANGDGYRDAQDDEFVELINTSSQALDLSGISIADVSGAAAGVRHAFPCGTVVPARRALVVFGGGAPNGSFGGSAVFTSNATLRCAVNRSPRSLCLNNSRAEGVVISEAPPGTGAELSRLEFRDIPGLATGPNASYARCSSTTPAGAADCDTGDTYVRHDEIPGVAALFSPGTKVDGATTSPPADRCETATEIAAPGALPNQTTLGLSNDYDPDASCLGYEAPGPDRVYTIVVPSGGRLAATVTPDAATYDVAVYVIIAPAASCDVEPLECAAGVDDELEGIAETVEYENTSGAAEQVFIIVDGYDSAGGPFSLSTTLTP